jgi:hypothetical protein
MNREIISTVFLRRADRPSPDDSLTAADFSVRRIVVNPEILGGKPIVESARLSVAPRLGLLAHGMS